jgi:diaminohydroxyphosphoribosylaminopyrimidine deaminase/5-amino-6-(5-phosphoribosylamino)uracil reductase
MDDDHHFMKLALAQGQQARIHAPPNPWVGAVIVQQGKIVGEGFTQPVGQAHAEVMAIRQAGHLCEGSTLYVTLEPCSHFGRTPPCVDAVIQAKIAKVVIALEDPDPRVQGQGIRKLKEAGIQVLVGIEAQKAFEMLEPYLFHRKTGKPFCIAKAAISVDGRTAAPDNTSKWITNEKSRQDAQRLRAESQAILVGTKTAHYDQPKLTIRSLATLPPKPPLRVVLDRTGTLNLSSPLFDLALAPTLVVTSSRASQKAFDAWQSAGIEYIVVPETEEGIDINALMETLGKRGILQILVEGGATLLGNLLKENLIQLLHLYIGPRILGDQGIPLFKHFAPQTLSEAPQLTLQNIQQFDECIHLCYRIQKEWT